MNETNEVNLIDIHYFVPSNAIFLVHDSSQVVPFFWWNLMKPYWQNRPPTIWKTWQTMWMKSCGQICNTMIWINIWENPWVILYTLAQNIWYIYGIITSSFFSLYIYISRKFNSSSEHCKLITWHYHPLGSIEMTLSWHCCV